MTNKADGEAYFREVERKIRDYYLADPSNPYRQSGKTGGAKHWEITRRCIAQAVNADGDYLDLGCANGLLLASLVRWCAERGFTITPHGVDFIPELIDLAKRRLPAYAANFHVANTFFWQPPRRYRFAQLLLDAVPPADQHAYVARALHEIVATPGRLIVSVYGQGTSATPKVAVEALADLGFEVAGATACVSASVAWIDRSSDGTLVRLPDQGRTREPRAEASPQTTRPYPRVGLGLWIGDATTLVAEKTVTSGWTLAIDPHSLKSPSERCELRVAVGN